MDSGRADGATTIFAGVEQVAEGDNLQGLSQQEVRALSARAYQWESLLDDDGDDDNALANTVGSASDVSGSILDTHGIGRGPSGSLLASSDTAVDVAGGEPMRRGMVRHLFVLADMTDAMKLNDYRPRRFEFMVDAVSGFASRFITENPLGSLGLGALRAGKCEVLSPCTGSVDNLKTSLQEVQLGGPQGRISIVNGLTSAVNSLKESPKHSTREVLLLVASLSTHDPQETPVDVVVQSLVENRIFVSVISMSAELFILKQVCCKTGGTYSAALDSRHFNDLLESCIAPAVCASSSAKPGLVLMGFPRRDNELAECRHTGSNTNGHSNRCFICPRCDSKVKDVPGPCPYCELPLTSGLLLTRSFQHLLPMSPWMKISSELSGSFCCGCQMQLRASRSNKFQCPTCRGHFCEDCTEFCKATLRKCPKCLETVAKRLRST